MFPLFVYPRIFQIISQPINKITSPEVICYLTRFTTCDNFFLTLLINYQNQMPTLHFPPNTLTIGADPEFTIHSSNNPTERDNFIPALRILPDPHYNNKLGHDGCSSTGELRPTPSTDPFRVYQSLDKIIHRLGKLHNDKRFFTSGVTSNPVGGHIHFGNLPFTSDQIKAITRSLDSLLFPVIFCLENENYSLERRGRSNYGKPGDIRNQPHGFEYRPLASWITSPITTKGTLATAYAIADETLKAKLPLSRNLPTPALLSNLVRMENSQRLVRKLIPDIGLIRNSCFPGTSAGNTSRHFQPLSLTPT